MSCRLSTDLQLMPTLRLTSLLVAIAGLCVAARAAALPTDYTGDGGDLQAVVDRLPAGATLRFPADRTLTLTRALVLRGPITLIGLRARLPERLGRTSLLELRAEGIRLIDLELQGNYQTVAQNERAPLVAVTRGAFYIEGAVLRGATKDGINVTAEDQDVVGGLIRRVRAEEIGRDAVSLSGGNEGRRVRNVVIEDIVLRTSFRRGAVEISDGTENVLVRGLDVADAMYAVDIQDHRGASAPNTNIVVENVRAVDCRYLIRTDNSPRGHAGLALRNLEGRRIGFPLTLSHTVNAVVEQVTFLEPGDWAEGDSPTVLLLANCQNVVVRGLRIADRSGPVTVLDAYFGANLRIEQARLSPSAPSPTNTKARAALLSAKVAQELNAAIAEDELMTARAARRIDVGRDR